MLSGIGKESDIGVVQSLHRQVKLAIDLYAAPDVARGGSDAVDRGDAGAPARGRAGQRPPAGVGARLRGDRAHRRSSSTCCRRCWTARRPSRAWPSTPSCAGRSWSGWRRSALLDEDEIAAEYERDKTAAGERHAATARAARPTAEAKAEAWASVVESDKLPNAVQEAVIGGFVQTDQRELLAPYTEKYFAAVKDVWESRSHEIAQQIAVGLYPSLQVSQDTLDATDAWLDSAEPNAALRRLISESRAGVERALKAQAADAAAA